MSFCFERKIDAMGRVVIPRDVRLLLEVEEGDVILLSVEGDRLIITKKENGEPQK